MEFLNVVNGSEERMDMESEGSVDTSGKCRSGRAITETHCCDAVGNVVFTARAEQLTFWEKKLAEGTWSRGLFCL